MSNEPTPRTDDQSVRYYDDATGKRIEYVSSRFARQLVRELAQSQEANAWLMKACDALERELAEVTKQRDALAEAIITHRAKAFPLTGEDFDQELWQALQSLTPKP